MNRKRLFPMLVVVLMAACATPQEVPEDRFYRLVDVPTQELAPGPLVGLAEVERVEAHGLYRDRAIVFTLSDTPESLDRHRYHFWALPPPEMLRRHFAVYLDASNLAGQVSTGELNDPAELRIRLIVRRFERVIDPAGPVSVRVAMRAVAERDARTLIVRDLDRTEPASDPTPGASVRAMSVALTALYAELVSDLAAVLAESG